MLGLGEESVHLYIFQSHTVKLKLEMCVCVCVCVCVCGGRRVGFTVFLKCK